jgi:hypothetical protein
MANLGAGLPAAAKIRTLKPPTIAELTTLAWLRRFLGNAAADGSIWRARQNKTTNTYVIEIPI